MALRERTKNLALCMGFFALDLAQIMYHGEYRPFVRSYGHDAIIPVTSFFAFKYFSRLKSRSVVAAYAFSGCSAVEIAQKYGWYDGTYDPKDFLAYAVGTLVALGVDAAVFRNTQSIDNVVK